MKKNDWTVHQNEQKREHDITKTKPRDWLPYFTLSCFLNEWINQNSFSFAAAYRFDSCFKHYSIEIICFFYHFQYYSHRASHLNFKIVFQKSFTLSFHIFRFRICKIFVVELCTVIDYLLFRIKNYYLNHSFIILIEDLLHEDDYIHSPKKWYTLLLHGLVWNQPWPWPIGTKFIKIGGSKNAKYILLALEVSELQLVGAFP